MCGAFPPYRRWNCEGVSPTTSRKRLLNDPRLLNPTAKQASVTVRLVERSKSCARSMRRSPRYAAGAAGPTIPHALGHSHARRDRSGDTCCGRVEREPATSGGGLQFAEEAERGVDTTVDERHHVDARDGNRAVGRVSRPAEPGVVVVHVRRGRLL